MFDRLGVRLRESIRPALRSASQSLELGRAEERRKGQVFRTIAAAALRAGFGVVAVTRTDGSRQVRDELARARELTGSGGAPTKSSRQSLHPCLAWVAIRAQVGSLAAQV